MLERNVVGARRSDLASALAELEPGQHAFFEKEAKEASRVDRESDAQAQNRDITDRDLERAYLRHEPERQAVAVATEAEIGTLRNGDGALFACRARIAGQALEGLVLIDPNRDGG